MKTNKQTIKTKETKHNQLNKETHKIKQSVETPLVIDTSNKQTKEIIDARNTLIDFGVPKEWVDALYKQGRKDAIDEILKIIDNLPLFLFSDFQRQKLQDKIAKEMQE
jgi:hypothetical protein